MGLLPRVARPEHQQADYWNRNQGVTPLTPLGKNQGTSRIKQKCCDGHLLRSLWRSAMAMMDGSFEEFSMTGTRRNIHWIYYGLAAAVVAGFLLQAVRADPDKQDLARQRDKQKDVRSDTDHVTRRTSTMLRVLDYYKLDRSAEKRLLDEVASTLAGLSKEQMAEVIARLEKAAKVP